MAEVGLVKLARLARKMPEAVLLVLLQNAIFEGPTFSPSP
jgi:hypothetical protein